MSRFACGVRGGTVVVDFLQSRYMYPEGMIISISSVLER
jgi:hypothetical protein